MLLGTLKADLSALSEELGREIEVRARPGMHQEQFEVLALGAAATGEVEATLSIPWLTGSVDPAGAAEDEDEDDEEEVEFDAATPSEPGSEAAEAPGNGRGEADAAGADAESEPPSDDAEAVEPSRVDSNREFRILPRSGESEEA